MRREIIFNDKKLIVVSEDEFVNDIRITKANEPWDYLSYSTIIGRSIPGLNMGDDSPVLKEKRSLFLDNKVNALRSLANSLPSVVLNNDSTLFSFNTAYDEYMFNSASGEFPTHLVLFGQYSFMFANALDFEFFTSLFGGGIAAACKNESRHILHHLPGGNQMGNTLDLV